MSPNVCWLQKRRPRGQQQPAGTTACSEGPAVGRPQGVAARGQQGRQRQPQGWLPLDNAAAGGQWQLPPAQGQRRRRKRGKRD
ncbi:hypothetical protein BHE74_00017739 [Ensete ventricosum]|nr:hypothetical protein BHE74_00017739 [Ensete ventricosum]